jgi:hypothetical protein
MKILRITFIVFIAFLFRLPASKSQLTDSIVALNNYPLGSLYFCKIDIATGGFANYQLIANGVSGYQSSCVNYDSRLYYFSEGNSFSTVDAVTGSILSTTNFPINASAKFTFLKFNRCDSMIYGVIYDAPDYFLSKFNPLTGVMNIISSFSGFAFPCGGCMSVIDPDSSLLIIDAGYAIVGIDLWNGQMKYFAITNNLPNETFGHIALNCNTHEIVGTSANINAGVKYLSKIDLRTGQVIHISNTGWNIGVWKPMNGGDCINQLTGDYFYSGQGSLLQRVNTTTGNLISSQAISQGELYYMDHFSSCNCNSSIPPGISEIEDKMQFIYEKLTGEISIRTISTEKKEITIFDVTAKIIFKKEFISLININTTRFNSGLYLYVIKYETGKVINGKFIK